MGVSDEHERLLQETVEAVYRLRFVFRIDEKPIDMNITLDLNPSSINNVSGGRRGTKRDLLVEHLTMKLILILRHRGTLSSDQTNISNGTG